MFIMWSIGNIVSPQLFISAEAPGYKTGCHAMLVASMLCLALTVLLGVHYKVQNTRRDRLLAVTPEGDIAAMSSENEEFLDRTDIEDKLKFRYRW